MSLNAFIWVNNLPIDLLKASEFRVLLRMADVADENGNGVWLSRQTIATQLGCHVKTVQRALSQLKVLGLIEEGDKRAVQHIRHDRRPVVYNLTMAVSPAAELLIYGGTEMSTNGGTEMSRGDKMTPNGGTHSVPQTVIKPNKSSLSVNHRSNVSNVTRHPKFIHVDEVLADCSNESGHAFSRGVCSHCNKAREVLREEATA